MKKCCQFFVDFSTSQCTVEVNILCREILHHDDSDGGHVSGADSGGSEPAPPQQQRVRAAQVGQSPLLRLPRPPPPPGQVQGVPGRGSGRRRRRQPQKQTQSVLFQFFPPFTYFGTMRLVKSLTFCLVLAFPTFTNHVSSLLCSNMFELKQDAR